MAIVIYAESENGKIKKIAFELASYGRALADKMGIPLIAVTFNQEENDLLGSHGVEKVIKIRDESLNDFNAKQYAKNIATVAKDNQAKMVVLSAIDLP